MKKEQHCIILLNSWSMNYLYYMYLHIFLKINLVLWFCHIIQWQTVTIHVLMLYWCNTNTYEYCTYFDILCFDIYLSVLFRNNLNKKLKSIYFHFQSLGFDLIVCVAVNDPFVMSAWAESLKTKDKVRYLSSFTFL